MTRHVSAILLALLLGLALSACGGSGATSTPSAPTAAPLVQPTSLPPTAPPPTAAPTQPPIPVRSDIPMMTDAANVMVAQHDPQEGPAYSVNYVSASPLDQVSSFYQAAMPGLGWTPDGGVSSANTPAGQGRVLAFRKDQEQAAVTLTNAGGVTQVIVSIAPLQAVSTEAPPQPAPSPTTPAPAAGSSAPDGADDIPLMPDAGGVTTAASGDELVIGYQSPSTVDQVTAFYQSQMPASGWTARSQVVSGVAGVNAVLDFDKDGRQATVTITNLGMGAQVAIAVRGRAEAGNPAPTAPPAPQAPAPTPPPPPTQPPAPAPTPTPPPPPASGPRDDIPFMPDATNLDVSAVGGDYTATYNTPSSVDAVVAFYQQQMPPRGWTYLADDAAIVPGVTATLYFAKSGEEVVVVITNQGVTQVQIDLQ